MTGWLSGNALAAVVALTAATILYAVDWLAHLQRSRQLDFVALVDRRGRSGVGLRIFRAQTSAAFALLPFLWVWLQIAALLLVIDDVLPLAATLLASMLLAGRMRALQEASHYAVHAALGLRLRPSLALADLFFQIPMGKPPAAVRRRTHVDAHHRHRNDPERDPNLRELSAASLFPGTARPDLIAGVLFPILPRGLWQSLIEGPSWVLREAAARHPAAAVARLACLFAIPLALFLAGGPRLALLGWVAPRYCLYPLFAWWSLLTEHVWYGETGAAGDYSIEMRHARATRYGFPGALAARFLLFPFCDDKHLAHSIFPYVRFNHLRTIDRHLADRVPGYTETETVNFCSRADKAGAFTHILSLDRMPKSHSND